MSLQSLERRVSAFPLTSLLAMLLLSGCMLGPRPSATAIAVAAAPDATTLLLLDAARSDQRAFEAFRRSTFPIVLPILSESFACTEKLGIYCIDRVTGGLARIDAQEDTTVAAAREMLIGSLHAANSRMPTDGWIQGQLVRYLVEGGNHSAASASAANCRADPLWWCFALSGYVLHRAGYSGPSEEAFRVALQTMPAEERAHWLDLSPLLDPEAVAVYSLLGIEEFARFEDLFWRLSDPLLTRPGNEVLTEHLARRVELNLQLEAETAEGPLGDRDVLETIGRYDLLLRYGLPDRWVRGMGKSGMVQVISREESRLCTQEPCGAQNYVYTVRGADSGEFAYPRGMFEVRTVPGIGPGTGLLAPPMGVRDLIAYYEVPPQDLRPPSGLLLAMNAGREGDTVEFEEGEGWDLIQEVPQTAYAIPMEGGIAKWIAPLAHQLAIFPRGDSAIVVAGWDLLAHGLAESVRVDAGVALLPSNDLLANGVTEVAAGAPASGVLMLRSEARPTLLSVEAAVPEELTMARARYGLDLAPLPEGDFAISDLLLLQGTGEELNSLEQAVEIALGSTRVPPGDLLGVYWEIYGLDATDSPEVTMSLALREPPEGRVGGAFRWLGETLGVLDEVAPIQTEWVEEVIAGPWMGRSLTFRIPDMAEGRYTLVMTATVPGEDPVMAAQEIEVTRSTISAPTAGTLIRRPDLTRPTRCLPETPITASAFSVADARDYFRTPRCMYSPDPSWFGHYGGVDLLSEYGYDGW